MGPKTKPSYRSVGLAAACSSTLIPYASAFCPSPMGALHSNLARRPIGIAGISACYAKRRGYTPLRSAVLNHTSSSSSSSVVASEDFSNFWFTVTQKDKNDNNLKWPPVVPSLDAEGALPSGCYKVIGAEECQPKPTCAIGITIDDLKRSSIDDIPIDANEVVQGMQTFIDHGFTTFHLPPLNNNDPTTKRKSRRRTRSDTIKRENRNDDNELWLPSSSNQMWGESQIYGRLQKSIPASVARTCHLVVPISTPPNDCHVTRLLVRQAVAQSLQRIGTDSIDTLEIQFCIDSPNGFDMMDYLMDLQREGMIRSIAGSDFPTTTLRTLEDFGFHLDYHKRHFNLLVDDKNNDDTTTTTTCSIGNMADYLRTAADLDIPNIISNPLGGGLLTDRFEGRVYPPLSSKLIPGDTKSSNKQFLQDLQAWAGRMRRRQKQTQKRKQRRQHHQQGEEDGDGDDPIHHLVAWKEYQNVLLPQLREIARNYRVSSIDSVALRWVLQMEQTAGTIVGCDFSLAAANQDASSSSSSSSSAAADLATRIKNLRNTFRFELDEDDMELIREVSGTILPRIDEGSGNINRHHTEDGLDLNNPKLWL